MSTAEKSMKPKPAITKNKDPEIAALEAKLKEIKAKKASEDSKFAAVVDKAAMMHNWGLVNKQLKESLASLKKREAEMKKDIKDIEANIVKNLKEQSQIEATMAASIAPSK